MKPSTQAEMPVSERAIVTRVTAGGNLDVVVEVPESLEILSDPKARVKAGLGCMRIMTVADGDKRVVWDKNRSQEIRDAKLTFNKLVEQGLVPYRVGPGGKASPTVMAEFDAEAEEILFLPIKQVVGG